MVRSPNLKRFKSLLKSIQSALNSVQKIAHFLSFPSKSWCKFFSHQLCSNPRPIKIFAVFFFYPLSAKINTSPHLDGALTGGLSDGLTSAYELIKEVGAEAYEAFGSLMDTVNECGNALLTVAGIAV